MKINDFKTWAQLNEEAQAEQVDQLILKADQIANDPVKMGGILKCIKGKPKLEEAFALGGRALVLSILMGIAGYLTVQSGGLAYPMVSAIAGYGAGKDLENLSKIDKAELDREIKSCKACLEKHI